MAKEIIWLDNDEAYIQPHVLALNDAGYKVSVVENVTDAVCGIFPILIFLIQCLI